jgi:YlmC/YmxH family sporulation protein
MYMSSRIVDLRNKQVVCTGTGCILGYVSDVEFSLDSGQLLSIVIFGRPRFFGLFGREADIVIPWNEIKVIGQETVLVNTEPEIYSKFMKHRKYTI